MSNKYQPRDRTLIIDNPLDRIIINTLQEVARTLLRIEGQLEILTEEPMDGKNNGRD